MQFPVVSAPQISSVAAMSPASDKSSAFSAFADVMAALRGAPAVAKAGSDGSAVALRHADETSDRSSDLVVTDPVVAMPDGPSALVATGQTGPALEEDAMGQGLTGREAETHQMALPVVARGPSEAAGEAVSPGGGDTSAPVVGTVPVASPANSLPAISPVSPAESLPQAEPPALVRSSVQHPPLPISRALPDVAAPVTEKGGGTAPAPQLPPAPATVTPTLVTRPVAPPPPARPAEALPVLAETASPRPETGVVAGPAPSEGPRPGLSVSPAAPVTQHAVSAQIAVALGRSADGTIDIALHPQELGRLRLSLTPTDTGMVVTIAAERPETLDLLRRHAAELGQDLRSLGFRDIDLNFGAPGSDHSRGHPLSDPGEDVAFARSAQPAQLLSPSPVPPVLHGVGGLDIRL